MFSSADELDEGASPPTTGVTLSLEHAEPMTYYELIIRGWCARLGRKRCRRRWVLRSMPVL